MLKTARGTQALIDLEDRAPTVLLEHVEGSPVPLWPQIRSLMSVALNELDYSLSTVPAPEAPRASAWTTLAKSYLPSRRDARLARDRTALAFLVGGNTVHGVNGRHQNWLIGAYADANADRATVVQWAELPSRFGPPAFSNTWSLHPALTQAPALARLSRRDPTESVTAIVNEAVRQLDVQLRDDQVATIIAAAISHERARPHIDSTFARILDRVRPSVVVMEDASYGSWASLITMMKDRGISVVEPQHGWIGPTHAAYNFGKAMFAEPLSKTLPDELLTFGKFWGEGLRFPGRIVILGKPHLDSATANLRHVSERTEVLVVSSTSDPDEMSQFVLSLRRQLDPSWSLVFRPHPSERPVLADRYPTLVEAPGIRIDERADVYDSLRAAAAVIGVASTVLFEAPAFGCRVFVRDSPLIDYYVGDRFGTPIATEADLTEVAATINRRQLGDDASHRSSDDLWAPAAVQTFQSWVENALRR